MKKTIDDYGGYAGNKSTGKIITLEEMYALGTEFDNVRNEISIDEFMNKHIFFFYIW